DCFRRAARLAPGREAFAAHWTRAEFGLWSAEPSAERALRLREAIEALRRANFRNPLAALAEGSAAEANGARVAALAIYRRGLERAGVEPEEEPDAEVRAMAEGAREL